MPQVINVFGATAFTRVCLLFALLLLPVVPHCKQNTYIVQPEEIIMHLIIMT